MPPSPELPGSAPVWWWWQPLTPAYALSLPPAPGSYGLRLELDAPARCVVGRLCAVDLAAGVYIYLGSARGPGGLRARLMHHARPAARPHWHLDFLRPPLVVAGGWHCLNLPAPAQPRPYECAWSQAALRLPGARPAAPGFGASDCQNNCPAHLIYVPGSPSAQELENLLRFSAPLAAAG